MPDGDVIPRTPVRLWKKPYKLLLSSADSETVADAICQSLLASLRDKGGLPGVQNLASVVDDMVDGSLSLSDALEETNEVEWHHGAHIHTRLAAEATRAVLVEVSQGKVLGSETLGTVIEESCHQIIRYNLLGRIGPDRQGVWYSTHEEHLKWERGILAPLQSRIGAIASNVAVDPTGRNLPRSGQRSTPHQPRTPEMLGTNLLEMR